MQLSLGVVEQSPIRRGGSAGDALRETIELAVATEAMGYERFWVAEHHNLPGIASTSPEILIGQIAARTAHMRVGSGGVMLPHYSAFKVAENFRMLDALFPGRIDLGLGRAPGGDQRTAAALAAPRMPIDVRHYPQQVDDLIGFLADDLPADHPFATVRASAGPAPTTMPEVWLLGSGIDSAMLAAERGLPFSFAHFFGTAAKQGPAIVDHYRQNFVPSAAHPEPRVHVAVQVLCGESDEEAAFHASSLKLSRINMARGKLTGMVPPEEASQYDFDSSELAFLERSGLRSITGSAKTVKAELDALAERYGTGELGVVTICYHFDFRLQSYERLAEACDMKPRPVASRPAGEAVE